MKKYKHERKQAKAYFLRDEYEKAEVSYKAALEQAKKMKWNEGEVIVNTDLGVIYTTKLEFSKAENAYKEARKICESTTNTNFESCSYVYDHLFTLYVVKIKDVSKAEKVIELVQSFGNRLTDTTMKERFSHYNSQLQAHGFDEASERLLERMNELNLN